MSIHKDKHGLALTAASKQAVRHYDSAVTAYLRFDRDTGAHLKAALQADPAFLMAHCTKGYFFQLFCNRALQARAQAELDAARAAAQEHGANAREQAHIAALAAWCQDDLRAATNRWEQILLDYPLDTLALRLAHFTHFYLGSSRQMRDSVARVLYAWNDSVPDYGFVLGAYAFGLEETGNFDRAEAIGKQAVELNPADIWAVHAVAHVMEMQGRHRDGVSWLADTIPGCGNANNFSYHVWWHRCLFHLELEQYDEVLMLYDARVRGDQDSDDYLDIANAVSLLCRLEGTGIDVGERWHELADKSARRVDDHVLAFADAHFMMALTATGWHDAAERMLASMRDTATGKKTQAPVYAHVGLPLCEALWAYRQGDYGQAVDLMLPIRYELFRIGGSHAQRDLFEQILAQAAFKAGRHALTRALLSERTARKPTSIWSWARYAEALEALADHDGARAARTTAARLLAA